MAAPKYLTDDLFNTALVLAGQAPARYEGPESSRPSVKDKWARLMGEGANDTRTPDEKALAKVVGGYLKNLGTEHLQALLVYGGVPEDLAVRAINDAQGGKTPTPTLRAVLTSLERDPRGGLAAQPIIDRIKGAGAGETALDTTRTEYRTGKAPAVTPGMTNDDFFGPGWKPGPTPPPFALDAPAAPAPSAQPAVPTTEPKSKAEVAALQTALNAKGAGLTVDGIMGPKTRAAWNAQGGPSAPQKPARGSPAAGTGTTPTAGATTTQTGVGTTASPAEQEAYVRGHYGYLAGWLDDPEVGPKLRQAAKDGWDEKHLEGELSTTVWWASHSDAQRKRQNEERIDPATYRAGITQKRGEVEAEAGRQGVTIPPDRLDLIAADAYKSGMSPLQLTAAVGSEFHYDPQAAKQPGEVGNLKEIASSYLVPLDDGTIDQWTRDILAGRSTDAAFTEYMKGQAKSLFPTMGSAIDSGQTVAQYVAPYKSAIAQTLEIPSTSVDFMDPKYMRLLTSIDPKTNQPVAKPIYQALTDLRTDPSYGYSKTSGAKEQAAQFSTQLAQTWGVAG